MELLLVTFLSIVIVIFTIQDLEFSTLNEIVILNEHPLLGHFRT